MLLFFPQSQKLIRPGTLHIFSSKYQNFIALPFLIIDIFLSKTIHIVSRNNNNEQKNSSAHLLAVNWTKFTIVKHEKEVGLQHGNYDSTVYTVQSGSEEASYISC